MSLTLVNKSLAPSGDQLALICESSRILDSLALQDDKTVDLQISGHSMLVPAAVARMLAEALHQMAEGKSVAVVSLEDELSLDETAELLNVPKHFILEQIDSGELTARLSGGTHYFQLGDVLSYKQKSDADRDDALAELVQQAQELKMGY